MTEKNTKKDARRQERSDSTALAVPGFGLSRTFEELMRPFEEFMRPMQSMWADLGGKEPNIDIQDRGDHFLLTAELPGFEKNEVEVQVRSNAVELKAEKENKITEDERVQRSYSYFHRYMALPERVRSEKVDGSMKNGVLELKLKKIKPSTKDSPRRVHLN